MLENVFSAWREPWSQWLWVDGSCLKRPIINKKRPGLPHLKNIFSVFNCALLLKSHRIVRPFNKKARLFKCIEYKRVFYKSRLVFCVKNVLIKQSSFFKWADSGLFLFIFILNKHKFYRKKCSLQQDSNSDCQSSRWARWPIDHHPVPLVISMSS